ncbi:unnamed protein product [Amoebophrya sp. A25]|nr:unnamed protein product [Amoebophrya sp. A25]|eukprot:GSA25T00021651001.1
MEKGWMGILQEPSEDLGNLIAGVVLQNFSEKKPISMRPPRRGRERANTRAGAAPVNRAGAVAVNMGAARVNLNVGVAQAHLGVPDANAGDAGGPVVNLTVLPVDVVVHPDAGDRVVNKARPVTVRPVNRAEPVNGAAPVNWAVPVGGAAEVVNAAPLHVG